MQDSFREYVAAMAKLRREAEDLAPASSSPPPSRSVPGGKARTALIVAPHPDDECLMGLWPLRLSREAGWRVVVVAMSLGSDPGRKAERWIELQKATRFLQWDLFGEDSGTSPEQEQYSLFHAVRDYDPQVIFCPHMEDGHPRHRLVRKTVGQVLETMPKNFDVHLVETEYWRAMDDPNLLVEGDSALVGDLVSALSCHHGEVRRNPYHLTLPAWMMDNVRRGAEILGGAGSAAPDFVFGTLYRWSRWREGQLHREDPREPFLSMDQNPENELWSKTA